MGTDLIIVGVIFISFITLFWIAVKKWLELNTITYLVKSEETHNLKEIPGYLGQYMEVYAPVMGETLISPVSQTPCVMYKVELFYSLSSTGVGHTVNYGTMYYDLIEQNQINDTYLVQDGNVIQFDLKAQKKVFMSTTEWHLFKRDQKEVVERYLHSDRIQMIIKARELEQSKIFGFRESIIPRGEPVYVLGRVSSASLPQGEYINTPSSYNCLPYTIIGHMDATDETHFLKFLKWRRWIQVYFMVSYIALSLAGVAYFIAKHKVNYY